MTTSERASHPGVGRGVAPSRAGLVADRARTAGRRLRADLALAWSLRYVRHGFWGAFLIALGAYTPAFLPPDSFIVSVLGLSWLEDGPSRVLATGLIIGGMALLLHAWLRLRPRGSAAAPRATWLVWSLPFLVTPPLFSRDAYSYAAQGLIVDRGMDPYTTAPISVPGSFADQVDAMWLYTPAPYGPLALQLQHLVVDLSFGNAFVAALAMRIPAVVAVAVLAAFVPRLAARLGVDPGGALWLAVLNPLTLIHLVGGAHNDALMVVLVVVGLWFAADGRTLPAALTVAAAAGFKQTAVLALLGVAGLAGRWACGLDRPTLREHLAVCVRVGGTALAGFVALTLASGLGWGWVRNLSVPMAMTSYLAPTTLVGHGLELLLSAVRAPAAVVAVPVPAARILGALLAVATLVWLTFVAARRHPVGATAAAFGVVIACGPVVHAWYLLPCLAVLGVSRAPRWALQGAVWVVVFFVGYAAFDVAIGNGVVVLGVAMLAWALARLVRTRSDRVEAPLHRDVAHPGEHGPGEGEQFTSSPS